MQTLAVFGNPRRRKSGKRRSAAQRAATARMLAANRKTKSGGTTRRRKSRRRSSVVAAAPRRSARRSVRRSAKRSFRRFSAGMPKMAGVVGMLKSGLIGGAGAVGVDVAMGYVAPMLPDSMKVPINADGTPNYAYYGVKAALAIGVGHFGKRLAPRYAEAAANGALTVMAYQFLRPMVPTGVSLGFMNPAPTMRPRLNGVGAYVSGTGAYQNVRRLPAPGARRGAGAATAMSMVRRRQDAA